MIEIPSTLTDEEQRKIPEHLHGFVNFTRVRKHTEDLRPVVEFTRQDIPVALVICPQVDERLVITAAEVGACGFNADQIWSHLDGHTSLKVEERSDGPYWTAGPNKGRKVIQHEFQELAAANPDLIVECMVVLHHTRTGIAEMVQLPYKVEGEKVTWMHERTRYTDQVYGWLSHAILRTFTKEPLITYARRPLSQLADPEPIIENARARGLSEDEIARIMERGMDPKDFGIEEHEAQYHLDVVTAEALADAGNIVAINPENKTKAEILTRDRDTSEMQTILTTRVNLN